MTTKDIPEQATFTAYTNAAGGWGSVRALGSVLMQEHVVASGTRALMKQNKPEGFACVSCSWAKPADPHAFEFYENGAELRAINPDKAVFYASGRASLETSYLYQLMARMYGTNNLPDSSNMCHESTSVALPMTIGVAVGTVGLSDFDATDCILFFGHNTGTNAPRMLHSLEAVRKRGAPVITFNPLRERGLVSFVNPQSPLEMLTPARTAISTQYVQIKIGGDTAAVMGMAKWLIENDDAALAARQPRLLDAGFIADHTSGFEEFAEAARQADWDDIERQSGVTRAELEQAAQTYANARACMLMYGMGVTQHREAVRTIHMLTNLLLLRGNIGKPGAGICPIRGHSNVQGQRTVGITEKPELVPKDKLQQQYGFTVPEKKGLNTVEACEEVLNKNISAFFMLGGNFVRAIPDHDRMEPAWRQIPLTVQVLTHLNRSAIIHGKRSYLLPCLGRIEIDQQAGGAQAVSVEDSTGRMHGSHGVAKPASPHLLSEVAIVAEIAKRILLPNPKVNWNAWSADYGRIRDAIAATYPDIFHDFNQRMWTPGGFARPLAARERKWNTPNGKANFITPDSYDEDPDMPSDSPDTLRLMTTRGDNQFNTTVYGLDDRFRGVHGTRRVLLMNAADMARLMLVDGAFVTAQTVSADDIVRRVSNLRVQAFDIPAGCIMGYFPELNPLIPLAHHAKGSKVPAAKSIPVRLFRHAA